MSTETPRDRCTCAHDGHAGRCPFHTQEDFDAAEATREGAAETPEYKHHPDGNESITHGGPRRSCRLCPRVTAETPGGGGLTEAERDLVIRILHHEHAGSETDECAACVSLACAIQESQEFADVLDARAVQARAEVVARVEALADEWEALGFGTSIYESAGELAQILRAALAGPDPRGGQDGGGE